MAMVNQRLLGQKGRCEVRSDRLGTEAEHQNVSRNDFLHSFWLFRLNKGVSSFAFHFVMLEQGLGQVGSSKGFRKN
jgi:hypothetical protein